MRTLLLASAAVLALGGTGLAQNFSGNSPNNPRSTSASNITASDTRSHIAPALPTPGYDLTYEQLLQAAQRAVSAGRTGLAQQSLEQAETRLLTRAVPQGQGNTPDNGAQVDAIRNARIALSKGDRAGVLQNIQTAMAGPGMGSGTMGSGSMQNGSMGSGMAPAATMQPMPAPSSGGMGAPPTGANAAENSRIYNSCATPPCQTGTPPAAPGGTIGQGPTQLQQAPVNSPVATGAGGGPSGSKGTSGGSGTPQ